MNLEEKNWHVQQAGLIREDEKTIRDCERTRAVHYYEVGKRLTDTYGVYDGSNERAIPVMDKADLAHIYGVPISKLTEARRVVRYAPSLEIFESILDGYGSWTGIVTGWLAERTTGQNVQKLRQEPDRGEGTPAKIHIVNVPDKLRDGLTELGLSRQDARKAIFEYLSNATPNEIKLVWEVRTGKRPATDAA